MKTNDIVFKKEFKDSLRDRRSLTTAMPPNPCVASGPGRPLSVTVSTRCWMWLNWMRQLFVRRRPLTSNRCRLAGCAGCMCVKPRQARSRWLLANDASRSITATSRLRTICKASRSKIKSVLSVTKQLVAPRWIIPRASGHTSP